MKRYNPKDIEPKWQKHWAQAGIYRADNDSNKPKHYTLEFFPYPSGATMHVGHVRNYTIGDVLARHARQTGHNVLHPMGWDAFGLPAENYAIKTGISPRQAIDDNTERFKQQLTQMGFSYDWDREIDSTDPDYYKWTQWFFLLLHKRGLAYQQESEQWWCNQCKTILANEQVVDGKCWRHDKPDDPLVTKKSLEQWFFRITDYADRLLDDLETIDWSKSIKTMQRNWIGRSEGAEITFELRGLGADQATLDVFTTAYDTIYGVTFMVLAPEHPIVKTYASSAENAVEIEEYITAATHKSDIDREKDKTKTGVEIKGLTAINPVNGREIPVWVADYVLMGYGTGAVMAVPGEDARDHEFATKYNLPIIYTTSTGGFVDYQLDLKLKPDEYTVANSGEFDGMTFAEAKPKMLEMIDKNSYGKAVVQYKMRDWLISRQRYWGAPIPIIHCETCGAVPVPEDQLPVELPELDNFQPAGDGRSPLARATDWVNVDCPVDGCDSPAQRETDTMDGFACSSWYFLRFADPQNKEHAFSDRTAKYWAPVDEYIGGAEHAVMHLLYARFWTKVMFDAGLIEFQEPFTRLLNQGMILAPDGSKMSKSKNNTIEPDELIDNGYGADTVRVMEMFIGPWDQSAAWSVEGMGGCFKFLQRFWHLAQEYLEAGAGEGKSHDKQLLTSTHKTIDKVSRDMGSLGFNTAIAAMMEFVNDMYKIKAEDNYSSSQWQFALESGVQLLAPFAPHIASEMWQQLGRTDSVHVDHWPEVDQQYLVADTVTIAVQVNGKVRGEIEIDPEAAEADVLTRAKELELVAKHLDGKKPKKEIYVPGRIVNLVV
ncbi:MAG: leucine--tRNA ligase [Patescibacteria group bacterium]